jgi:LPXTG-motif cell wall-anchored protein
VTSTTAKQPTTTTTTTVKHLVPTTTLGRQGAPPTAVTTAPQGNIPVDSGTPGPEATTGELPFTGASTFPLAGIGALMVVTGLALSVRRRRLAR